MSFRPKGEIFEIPRFARNDIFHTSTYLSRSLYTYIPCTGASQFIDDFLQLLKRLEGLAPTIGTGPTISDLKYALSTPNEPIVPLYSEYLKNILRELERTKPDFSKFAEYDEAIVAQINEAISISYRVTEAALLASKYGEVLSSRLITKAVDAIEGIYNLFGNIRKLYDVPDDFSGRYQVTDFDGYKFLGFEMFVSLIAALIKNNKWEIIAYILTDDLFVEKKYDSQYVPFTFINCYVMSLDEIRNKRLNLRRISVMADLIKERFTQSELSQLIDHKEFMEADYFLFMRTVCHEDDLKYLRNVWCPRSCVWLDRPPSYIVKSESKRFLETIAGAAGFNDSTEFVERFKRSHTVFARYLGSTIWNSGPLVNFDLNKLGTRR